MRTDVDGAGEGTSKEVRMSEQRPGPDIDTSVSHVARIWNYWLGGKDNYPVDREVGDQILGCCRTWRGWRARPGCS